MQSKARLLTRTRRWPARCRPPHCSGNAVMHRRGRLRRRKEEVALRVKDGDAGVVLAESQRQPQAAPVVVDAEDDALVARRLNVSQRQMRMAVAVVEDKPGAV